MICQLYKVNRFTAVLWILNDAFLIGVIPSKSFLIGWIQPLLTVQNTTITGTEYSMGYSKNSWHLGGIYGYNLYSFNDKFYNLVVGYKAALMYKMCASVSDPAIYCKRNELEMKLKSCWMFQAAKNPGWASETKSGQGGVLEAQVNSFFLFLFFFVCFLSSSKLLLFFSCFSWLCCYFLV